MFEKPATWQLCKCTVRGNDIRPCFISSFPFPCSSFFFLFLQDKMANRCFRALVLKICDHLGTKGINSKFKRVRMIVIYSFIVWHMYLRKMSPVFNTVSTTKGLQAFRDGKRLIHKYCELVCFHFMEIPDR